MVATRTVTAHELGSQEQRPDNALSLVRGWRAGMALQRLLVGRVGWHIRHTLSLHQSHQRAESGNAQREVDTVFCTGILDISVHCSRAHSLGVQQSGIYSGSVANY